MGERLRRFAHHEFINLKTYKRSGQSVNTPVWFAHNGSQLFVRTADDTGKVKRLRNNPFVRIAPCDSRGTLLGEWVEATARVSSDEEARLANHLLGLKYGKLKSGLDAIFSLRGARWTVIVVNLAAPPASGEIQ